MGSAHAAVYNSSTQIELETPYLPYYALTKAIAI